MICENKCGAIMIDGNCLILIFLLQRFRDIYLNLSFVSPTREIPVRTIPRIKMRNSRGPIVTLYSYEISIFDGNTFSLFRDEDHPFFVYN